MTVSISRINIDYYLDSAAVAGDSNGRGRRDLTSYYTESQAPVGRWHGKGLAGVGLQLDTEVEKKVAKNIYEDAKHPVTKLPLGRPPMKTQQTPAGATTPKGALAKAERKAVSGFDLTFSVPKSISVLWALADPALQGELYAAHQQAVADSLEWLEREVIQARAGHAGVASVEVKGIIASLYDHWDSRAGDPQLHTHAVVANRVQRASDGQWVTLDSYTLHRNVVALSEKYNSLLFDRVYERTGAVAEMRAGTALLDPRKQKKVAELLQEAAADPRSPRAELIGVSDELIAEFSTRSVMIEDKKNELLAAWIEANGEPVPQQVILEMRREATLATRTAKSKTPTPLAAKIIGWQDRSLTLGFNPDKVIRKSTGNKAAVVSNEMVTDSVVEMISLFVLQQTSAKRSTFNRANLIAASERVMRGVRMSDAATRELLLNRVVDSAIASAVELSPQRFGLATDTDLLVTNRGRSVFEHQETAMYSTHKIMDEEAFLMSQMEKKTTALEPERAKAALEAARTREGRTLSPDQAEAAFAVLTSGKALDAVIGPAGTGKTTTMRAVRELWEAEHGPGSVVGLAPSAVAASVLGEELDITTDNISKWLYESVGQGASWRLDRMISQEKKLEIATADLARSAGNPRWNSQVTARVSLLQAKLTATLLEMQKYSLQPGQLLIIDEASMTGTTTLAALNSQAAAVGAKVLLVGDPAQLGAVEAGGFLGWMDRNTDQPTLSSVWRFSNEWEREASLRLRLGHADVLETYKTHERLVESKGTSAADAAYQGWLADTTAKKPVSSLLIAADNETVNELNTRAQRDLVGAGRVNLKRTTTLREGVAGVGDVILARRNDRKLKDDSGAFVTNGTRITINKIHRNGDITGTRADNDETIKLPKEYLGESVELGYACTAHRAQGVTVDTAHAVVQHGQQNRELFYVAMTRGRHSNLAYVEVPDEEIHAPDQWGIMQEIRPETASDVLTAVLANSSQEHTAHEVRNAEHGKANDLARLVFEYDYLGSADQTRQLLTWMGKHFAATEIQALQTDPDWIKLLAAKPALHYPVDQSPRGHSVEEIIAACEPATTEHDGGGLMLASITKTLGSSTPEQEGQQTILATRITERLNYLAHMNLEENAPWVQGIKTQYPHEPAFTQALRAVTAWRETSNQAEEETAWGKEPSFTDKMMYGYFRNAKQSMPSTPTTSRGEELPADPWIEPHDYELEERFLTEAEELMGQHLDDIPDNDRWWEEANQPEYDSPSLT